MNPPLSSNGKENDTGQTSRRESSPIYNMGPGRGIFALIIVIIGLLVTTITGFANDARGQDNDFTFGRVVYQSRSSFFRGFGYRWAVDYPSADANVIRALRSATTLKINEPKAIELTEPDLFEIPFLYILEVGALQFSQEEADALREYLLRGGFMMVDDFHGSRQWAVWESQIKKVFPDRPIIEVPDDHPVFHCYYDFEKYPLVPGIVTIWNMTDYERDGALYGHHCRGIFDDQGRLMVLINWNVDLGDGWEHAADPIYPRKFSVIAYRLAVNYAIYAMTH